jgi:hypothetical protein
MQVTLDRFFGGRPAANHVRGVPPPKTQLAVRLSVDPFVTIHQELEEPCPNTCKWADAYALTRNLPDSETKCAIIFDWLVKRGGYQA